MVIEASTVAWDTQCCKRLEHDNCFPAFFSIANKFIC